MDHVGVGVRWTDQSSPSLLSLTEATARAVASHEQSSESTRRHLGRGCNTVSRGLTSGHVAGALLNECASCVGDSVS